jgi:hypothetical protein
MQHLKRCHALASPPVDVGIGVKAASELAEAFKVGGFSSAWHDNSLSKRNDRLTLLGHIVGKNWWSGKVSNS